MEQEHCPSAGCENLMTVAFTLLLNVGRVENIVYMTDKGIRWFTLPPEFLASTIGKLAALAI
ncbi:MAG: hypothetical protein ACI8QG_002167 [Flavobacteriales bacterium]